MTMADPQDTVVLLVDDVPDNVALLHDALDEAGYTVLVALDGESALRRAAQSLPDVVLLDAVMPGLDGFEVARRDLHLRGAGEFLGVRQSGLPLLRFADLETDVKLLELARDAADWLMANDVNAAHMHLQRWLGNRAELLSV